MTLWKTHPRKAMDNAARKSHGLSVKQDSVPILQRLPKRDNNKIIEKQAISRVEAGPFSIC